MPVRLPTDNWSICQTLLTTKGAPMVRRSTAFLIASALITLFSPGCESGTKPQATPASNQVDYGDNTVPTPKQVKSGPRGESAGPGAPPARR